MKSLFRTSLFLMGLSLTGTMLGANWPAWRGVSGGQGISPETKAPLRWSATNNVRWRVELPEPGNATPIVWGDRVYVTQALADKNQRTLMCFNRETGKLLWQEGETWTRAESSHRTNPYCSASPVTDGERVIAWFGSAGVHAYGVNGKKLWSRDLGLQQHTWGYGTSPVLYKDLCILYFGPGKNKFLIALDKRTGKTVWKTEQPELQRRPRTDGFRGKEEGGTVGAFGTPILVKQGAGHELIMSYPQLICAYDPMTGQEKWRCDGLNELIYTSPVAGEGIVVGMGGYYGTTVAVKGGGSGDVTKSHQLWKKVRTKNRLGSAVIHQGHLYMLNSDGIGECLDLKTGKEIWQERFPKKGPKGDCWSSMVLVGDLIYVLNQSGDTVVIKASPKFEVVAVNPLDGALTNSSLAISNGEIFIRTQTHLWCIGLVSAETVGKPSPVNNFRFVRSKAGSGE